MNKKKLLSLIITICMVMLFVPTIAHAGEGESGSGSGAPVKVTVLNNSVDTSSISIDLFAVLRNAETGEEKPLGLIDTIAPENVKVNEFDTVKEAALEEAKAKLTEWLEMMRQKNPDVQFKAVGDMSVAGDTKEFDNRKYTMHGGDIIIGTDTDLDTGSGSGTTSRYMEVTGDYGKTGRYSVTMTVEVQGGAYFITEDGNGAASELEKSPQTGDSNMTGLWILLFFISGAGIAGATIYSRKKNCSAK